MEIDATFDIPSFIDIQMQDGSYVSVSVEVPWYPQRCTKCSIFGHADKTCPKKAMVPVAKIWVLE